MKSYLITFASQTQAGRLKSMTRKEQIDIQIVQTPKEISYGGCSFAVKCTRGDLGMLVSLCGKYGIPYKRVFAEMSDASGKRHYEEVRI